MTKQRIVSSFPYTNLTQMSKGDDLLLDITVMAKYDAATSTLTLRIKHEETVEIAGQDRITASVSESDTTDLSEEDAKAIVNVTCMTYEDMARAKGFEIDLLPDRVG